MYQAIGYDSMTPAGQEFFSEHFLILSGMYGFVRPTDIIGNYKLPIETKGLSLYWKRHITHALKTLKPDCIVNLLPLSYGKMIDFKILGIPVVDINFMVQKGGKTEKMAHGVKKIRGEWIRNICENGVTDYRLFE